MKILNKWKCSDGNYQCPHCIKKYSYKGISTHILKVHLGRKFGGAPKGRVPWNKNLNKNIDERILKSSKNLSNKLKKQVKEGIYKKNGWAIWTEEKRKFHSLEMSQNNPGGKSKWYEVNGKKVQGSWERDFALKLNEFDIKWERCKPIIYKKDEKEKRYTPDFYLPIFDKFIEIKGFWWGDDKEKMRLVLEQNIWLKNKIFIIEKKLFNEIKNYTKQELIRTLS